MDGCPFVRGGRCGRCPFCQKTHAQSIDVQRKWIDAAEMGIEWNQVRAEVGDKPQVQR